MRKATVAAFTVAAALGTAPGIAGAAPGDDLVAGSGKGIVLTPFGAIPSDFHLNAKGNALEGRGHAFARFYPAPPFAPSEVSGSVQCVDAVSNQAVALVRIEKSTSPVVPVGTLLWRKIIDNGGGAGDPPDQNGVAFATSANCPPATTPFPMSPLDQGNFVVHDGG